MTALTARKTRLIIETSDTIREKGKYRNIMVEAKPFHASIRLKGMRHSHDISWGAVWNLAVKIAVANERAEKAQRKQIGKKSLR